jgi:hypothetical protein
MNPTAVRFDSSASHNFLRPVVGALREDIGPQCLDEPLRRVFFEKHDKIHAVEGAQKGGAIALVKDRPTGPLEAPHRGVRVQAHDEAAA